jgi:hypothetical protein
MHFDFKVALARKRNGLKEGYNLEGLLFAANKLRCLGGKILWPGSLL